MFFPKFFGKAFVWLLTQAGSYTDDVGQRSCIACGGSSFTEIGSFECKCLGANRVYQASSRSCVCKGGYRLISAGNLAGKKAGFARALQRARCACSGITGFSDTG